MNSLPSKYRRLTTKDGSPTLEFTVDGVVENMHNFHGAFAETDYIYGEAMRRAIQAGLKKLRVLSVGLGIAYNEILVSSFLLKAQSQNARSEPSDSFEQTTAARATDSQIELLQSFEIDSYLKQSFLTWLVDEELTALGSTYDDVLKLYAEHTGENASEIKSQLGLWLEQGKFALADKFSIETNCPEPFHVLFYDPFSNKTNPDFWTEQALERFLQKWAADDCIISTYAATGALKRAFKNQGFQLVKRAGFGGKRQSFMGLRGQLSEPENPAI